MTHQGKPISITMLHNAISEKEPNVLTAVKDKTIKIVVATPSSRDSGASTAGYFLRRKALDSGAAIVIDIRMAMKLVDALYSKYQTEKAGEEFWSIESWHESHRIG
mmetsp:Transcript_18962/g.48645  ORF Transcript_18962/g.48645 Transcript_18962/m.48645 type:complete len:106 (+) Transcript_18962:1-318(+)